MKNQPFSKGYFTKTGAVFVVSQILVNDKNLVAVPGDIVMVDGELVVNLTRAAEKIPDRKYHLRGVKFLKAKVA